MRGGVRSWTVSATLLDAVPSLSTPACPAAARAGMSSEKWLEEVRKLQKLKSNKECFECTARVRAAAPSSPTRRGFQTRAAHRPVAGARAAARVPQAPQSVCFTHNTFVCNTCSGILCVAARPARSSPLARRSVPHHRASPR